MNFHSVLAISSLSFPPKTSLSSSFGLSRLPTRPINKATYNSCSQRKRVSSDSSNGRNTEFRPRHWLEPTKPCFCGRRHFIEAASLGTTLFPIRPANATNSDSDHTAMVDEFHPPRPDWYEELYAWIMSSATKSYEAEVALYKSQIFSNLRDKAHKILDIGVGTGPNFEYYASNSDVQVIGIDPNKKMEKYARSAAASAGLPVSNFEFIHAVGEAIPLSDASVDAVVGTLVLCSVKDVDMALKEVKRVLRPGGLYLFVEHVAARDGTILGFIQKVLDPLQQTIADGCHLSRETGKIISRAGFSRVELNTAVLSNATFMNPHIYGVAYK